MKSVDDLDVFKLARQLALKTYSTTKTFPSAELKPLPEVFVELANNVAESSLSANTEEKLTQFTPLEAYYEQLRGGEGELTESDAWPSVRDDGWPDSYVKMVREVRSGYLVDVCEATRFLFAQLCGE
jgi:hypothetical protein